MKIRLKTSPFLHNFEMEKVFPTVLDSPSKIENKKQKKREKERKQKTKNK